MQQHIIYKKICTIPRFAFSDARKSVLMEFPAQTHPEPTPYCSSTQAHPNPVGSSSTIATWYSRRYYLQSCFCQDLSAHPGPPMKSWAHPKPTLNPMGLGGPWVWVGWVQNSRLWSVVCTVLVVPLCGPPMSMMRQFYGFSSIRPSLIWKFY